MSHLAETFVDALLDRNIQTYVLREVLEGLGGGVKAARRNETLWERILGADSHGRGVRERRAVSEQEDPCKGMKTWSVRHGFFQPTLSRYGLVC